MLTIYLVVLLLSWSRDCDTEICPDVWPMAKYLSAFGVGNIPSKWYRTRPLLVCLDRSYIKYITLGVTGVLQLTYLCSVDIHASNKLWFETIYGKHNSKSRTWKIKFGSLWQNFVLIVQETIPESHYLCMWMNDCGTPFTFIDYMIINIAYILA